MGLKGVFLDISTRSDLRAYHASDIPLVFANYNASTAPAGPTAVEIALSQLIQTACISFARDPGNGLKNAPFAWSETDGNNVVLLGNSANPIRATFTARSSVDTDCGAIGVLRSL
jgi:carboxylesterase type B